MADIFINQTQNIEFVDLKHNTIRYHLANLRQITFEVTDACNLKCKYCGYGEFLSINLCWVLMRYLFLFAALFFTPDCFSQKQLENPVLLILDKETLQPVENCVLTDGVFTFGYTSTDGKVQVYPNCPKEIELKHVAYSSQIIDVSILPFQEITVLIKAKTIQLPDVNIYAKKERERYRKMGITKKRPFWGHLGYATSVFNHAQYIPNEDIRNNYILSAVHVYILSKGSPTLPFFITLYKGEDETLAPNEKLKMAGPVYCKALQGDAYFTLDVTAYNLEMPKTGLFVMIEPAHKAPPVYGTVKIGKTEWQTSTNKNQVFIGSANQHVNTYRTWRDYGKGWKRSSFPPKTDDSIVGNPMIYLTMKKRK